MVGAREQCGRKVNPDRLPAFVLITNSNLVPACILPYFVQIVDGGTRHVVEVRAVEEKPACGTLNRTNQPANGKRFLANSRSGEFRVPRRHDIQAVATGTLSTHLKIAAHAPADHFDKIAPMHAS